MSTALVPWFARPAARAWRCPPASDLPAAFHASLPGYAPTPLVESPALAAELGVGRVFVKDESSRLGLPAFKILGASWAVCRILAEEGPVPFDQLRDWVAGRSPVRLTTATAGNHGRALAHIARLLGLPARVFVPDTAHPGAVAAIAAEGAEVIATGGPYDDAVRLAAADARSSGDGAALVQDTAVPGHHQVPAWIVEGYSTLFAEVDAQLLAAGAGQASLVAVPVGVGSLAQAAVTHNRGRRCAESPALLAVEPVDAACVLASLSHGRPTAVVTGHTVMAGLNAGEPSSIAWPVLRDGLDAAIAVTDAASLRAARDLAGLGVPAGFCGAASLAGVRAALTGEGSASRRDSLAVTPHSNLVLLSTEGSAANSTV